MSVLASLNTPAAHKSSCSHKGQKENKISKEGLGWTVSHAPPVTWAGHRGHTAP